jgi:hypothetical protein
VSYLDFDQLLQPVDDGEVLVSAGRLGHHDLVAGPQPPAVLVPDEGFGRGLLVVQVAERDGRRLHEQLAGLAVLGNLLALGVDDLDSRAGNKRARSPQADVVFACRADYS